MIVLFWHRSQYLYNNISHLTDKIRMTWSSRLWGASGLTLSAGLLWAACRSEPWWELLLWQFSWGEPLVPATKPQFKAKKEKERKTTDSLSSSDSGPLIPSTLCLDLSSWSATESAENVKKRLNAARYNTWQRRTTAHGRTDAGSFRGDAP